MDEALEIFDACRLENQLNFWIMRKFMEKHITLTLPYFKSSLLRNFIQLHKRYEKVVSGTLTALEEGSSCSCQDTKLENQKSVKGMDCAFIGYSMWSNVCFEYRMLSLHAIFECIDIKLLWEYLFFRELDTQLQT